MPTLLELLTPKTREQVLTELLTALQGQPYPLSDWYPGAVGRTLIEIDSAVLADLYAFLPEIAKAGFLAYAEGGYLDSLVESHYDDSRKPSTFARHILRLTDVDGLGPYTIAPNQLYASTPDGKRFNNLAGGTLPLSGTLNLEFRAESPGAAYNVAAGTITQLLTPLPGVTVTNLAGTLLEAGVDQESDDLLRSRVRLKWASLGLGMTKAGYEYYALSADPAITKVQVLDQLPRGQGTVDVIVWGEGGLGSGSVAAADALIQSKRPVTADVNVYAAIAFAQTVQATISIRAGFLAAAQAAVSAALTQLQKDTPIGGTLYRSAVIEALFPRPYGINVNLTNPLADVVLTTAQAITLNASLTWQEV